MLIMISYPRCECTGSARGLVKCNMFDRYDSAGAEGFKSVVVDQAWRKLFKDGFRLHVQVLRAKPVLDVRV